MSDNRNVQEQFFAWLSKFVSGSQLSELYLVIDDIDRYCISMRITSRSFVSITDPSIVKKVIEVIKNDRSFRCHY